MIIFIPIKHISQRVPNKNFRQFGNEPLYKHTLLKYRNCKVYIDTDSDFLIDEIKKDSRLSNVVAFKRKESLQGHKVSVCDLNKNFIRQFSIEEPIVQMHVTSPFLTYNTVKDAYKKISKTDYDSVVSCNKFKSRFWRKEEYGFCPVNHNPLKMEQTQDLPYLYEENSAFYIFKPQVLLELNSRIGHKPYFYGINKIESIDIDTENDWQFATLINNIKNDDKIL